MEKSAIENQMQTPKHQGFFGSGTSPLAQSPTVCDPPSTSTVLDTQTFTAAAGVVAAERTSAPRMQVSRMIEDTRAGRLVVRLSMFSFSGAFEGAVSTSPREVILTQARPFSS